MLAPYDVLRLKKAASGSSRAISSTTSPAIFEMDGHGMPGLEARDQGRVAGLRVPDTGRLRRVRRPALGLPLLRARPAADAQEGLAHRRGFVFRGEGGPLPRHFEPRTFDRTRYRQERGVGSATIWPRNGATLFSKTLRRLRPSARRVQSMDLFCLASCGLDNFRVFIILPVLSRRLQPRTSAVRSATGSKVELLKFASRYLKQILFRRHGHPRKAGRGQETHGKRRQEINSSSEETPKTLAPEYDRPDEGDELTLTCDCRFGE